MAGIKPDFSGLDGGPKSDKLDFSGLDTKPPAPENTSPYNVLGEEALTRLMKGTLDLDTQRTNAAFDEMDRNTRARENFVRAVESQRQMISINNMLERKGINPLEHHSPGMESLKKAVDPLYEKTGIFIPLPVSFNIDEKGEAGDLAEDNTLLENNWMQRGKRTFAFAYEGVKAFVPSTIEMIASPFVAAKYHAALPLLEKVGAFDQNSSGLWRTMTYADLEGFRDAPIEEKNRMLDEAAMSIGMLAVEEMTAGLASGLVFKRLVGEEVAGGFMGARKALRAGDIGYLDALQAVNPRLVEQIARIRPELIEGSKIAGRTIGAATAGGSQPYMDKDENTGFKTAVAFGIIGGLLGRTFALKEAKKGHLVDGLDFGAVNSARELSNLRNLNIAAQASAGEVFRTAAILADTDLSLQNTLADLGKNNYGFTVVPISDIHAGKNLVERLHEGPSIKIGSEWTNVGDGYVARRELGEIWLKEETQGESSPGNVVTEDNPLFKKFTEKPAGSKAVSFGIDGKIQSVLVRGTDVPELVWTSSSRLFSQTGLLPNELVSVGGQVAMTIVDAELPKAGVRAAVNSQLGKTGALGVILRDPVTGRVAVVPTWAIRRTAGELHTEAPTNPIPQVSDEQHNAFTELANAQRGEPENAMLRVQRYEISQLYGNLLEHVGDLTNRMAQNPEAFKGMYTEVLEKVSKALRSLEHPYGVLKEINEQVRNNVRFYREKAGYDPDVISAQRSGYGTITRVLRERQQIEHIPGSPSYKVLDDLGNPVASVAFFPGSRDSYMRLDGLAALTRGGGRQAMEIIIKEADRLGITLEGKAMPLASQAGKTMTQVELNSWYKELGFVIHKDNEITRSPLTRVAGEDVPAHLLDEQEALTHMMNLGREYAKAHGQLKTHNIVQEWARQAAIALGEGNFDKAKVHLRLLRDKLKDQATWESEALKFKGNLPRPKTVHTLAEDFIKWANSGRKNLSIESRLTQTTPETTIANRDIYPNVQKIVKEFIEGEGGDATDVPDKVYPRGGPAGPYAGLFKRADARNTQGTINDFRIEGIYKADEGVDYTKLAQAILGRGNDSTLGYIDYITRKIAIRWNQTQRWGTTHGPELTLGHEIYHPIANGVVAHDPVTARNFFDRAFRGDDDISIDTRNYAKQLGAIDPVGGGVRPDGRPNFFHWSEHYPTWESRWEEVITNELGIRAIESGALTSNRTMRMPIGSLVDQYIDEMQLTGKEASVVRKSINNKIASFMYDILVSDESKALISNYKDTAIKTVTEGTARDLVNEASALGLMLDDAGSGRLSVRDVFSGEIVRTFDNVQQAREFLRNTDVPASKVLDVELNSELIPEAARSMGGGVMPPSGMTSEGVSDAYRQPFPYHKPGWFEKAMTFVNSSTPRFTAMRDYMIALDNTFGTQIYEKIYRPTQDAAFANNEARIGWLKRLSDIESGILGLHAEDRKLISAYRETMTPDEVVKSYLARPLNDAEKTFASQIKDLDVDLQKVFNYLRKVEELKQDAGNLGSFDFSGDVTNTIQGVVERRKAELQKSIEELGKGMGMDDNHRFVAGLFNQIKGLSPDDVSLGAVVRLARSYGKKDVGPELTRAEFAKKQGMTPAQLKVAEELDKLYGDLSEVFEIDDYKRLNGYMNHYRLYNELPEETSAFLRRLQKGARRINEKEFVSQLMRTGELGLFETDPIRAALSYINAGFSNANLMPAIRAAEVELANQLSNVKNRRGKLALNVLQRYLDELRGIPNMAVEQTQANFDEFLKGVGVEKDVNFRSGLVNMYLAMSNTATMGFRPALALRDLAGFYTAHGSRFGFDRTTNGLRLAMQPGRLEYLRSKGVLATIDIVNFLSPAEYESSGLRNASTRLPEYLRKVAEWGMTTSGQKSVFELVHAAAYLEVEDLLLGSGKVNEGGYKIGLLYKLQRGEVTKADLYKKAFINSYDVPVIKTFDALVSAGKMEEAAHFLAKATSEETGFVYNLANHPHGWETNTGRILGQFGTWPVWMSRYLTRLASRGTRKELMGVYSRFAISQAAVKGTEKVTGFNMYSWYLSPNFGYAGGPLLHAAVTAGEAINTSSDRVKQQKLRELTNMLPFMRYGRADISKPGSVFIPGSFAMQDWITAFQLYDNGYNPVTSLGKAFGFAVDTKRRSVLDNVFGSHHPFEY